jgi:isoleucyl-tRNA synthetase
LMAPFAPFIADELYRNLNGVTRREESESVHLALMPEPVPSEIDAPLEARMEKAEKIVILVRAMRKKSNLKVRQPLKRIILPIADERERDEVKRTEAIILDEINVKAIEYVTDAAGIAGKKAKGNFKSIGPKFGKSVQRVAGRIKELNAGEIARLEREGSLTISLGGDEVTIARDDVEITREDIPGWMVETEGGLTVALDTSLNDELIAEGIGREFVNRIQNMRKDAGFEVMDRIAIGFRASAALTRILLSLEQYIRNETLAEEFSAATFPEGAGAAFELNGEEVAVTIARRR